MKNVVKSFLLMVFAVVIVGCTPTPEVAPPDTPQPDEATPAVELESDLLPGNTSADVIVIGGGLGGLSAAVSATQGGASVILIEKMDILGGNTNLATGGFNAAGTRFQDDTEANSVQGTIDWWIANQDMGLRMGSFNPDRVVYAVERSSVSADWIYDMGWMFQVDVIPGRGHQPHNSMPTMPGMTTNGSRFVRFFQDIATDLGVEIHLNTRATELVQDSSGAVVGVVATLADGSEVEYTADLGVVLATGGWTRSPEMVERFLPSYSLFAPFSVTHISHQGDGMLLAEAVGADIYDDQFLISWDLLPGDPGFSANSISFRMPIMPIVDVEGNRFMREAFPGSQWGYFVQHILEHTPDAAPFVIFDSSEPFQVPLPQLDEEYNRIEVAEGLVADGSQHVYRGETIAELAEAIGIPVENLEATIATVNAVANGEMDDPFGKPYELHTAISVGPFYAVRFFASDMGTMGGIVTNVNYQVLDTSGNVIPGLFAVGEMSNKEYFGTIYMGGSSLSLTLSSGRIAGEVIAEGR